MKLEEILMNVRNSPDDQVIFARKPWSSTSDAELCYLNEEGGGPQDLLQRGFAYFMEIRGTGGAGGFRCSPSDK